MRIAIGGIGHETNTFSPLTTAYEDFFVSRGDALLRDELAAPTVPGDVQLLPTLHAWAWPGGLVRLDAYQHLKAELLAALEAALPLDGVYLILHGAMEMAEIGDGEGDLVSAMRDLVGPRALISASLDLHGNISPALAESCNILTALRTAPHRDGEQTRRRALELLMYSLRRGLRPVCALVKPPLVLPGEAAMTTAEPAKSLYARLPEMARQPGILDASLLVGCAWTDSPYTSASAIVVAESDGSLARRQAGNLAAELWARRRDFAFGMAAADPDQAIRQALASEARPAYVTDSGDNVTAGGAGDIPLLAQRLLALGADEALVAGLTDAQAVQTCAAAGEGATVRLALGGKLDTAYAPVEVSGEVLRVTWEGGKPALAALQVLGVAILLAIDRRPFTDRVGIAAAGLDPAGYKLIAVKQGYLFPDLADHTTFGIMALTPGATDLRLERLPYRHLRRPAFPLDEDAHWEP